MNINTHGVVIKLCDVIMGSGKTSAAIQMMNNHPENRYIYAAEYIDENKRIERACPTLNFALPELGKSRRKRDALKHLLYQKRNVAITHALFRFCDEEVCGLIRKHGYILILDETLHVIRETRVGSKEIDMLVQNGDATVDESGNIQIRAGVDKSQYSSMMQEELRYAASGMLYMVKRGTCCCWSLSPEMFASCKQVYILTYLFDGSILSCFCKMHKFDIQRIYVRPRKDGSFEFTDSLTYLPEYVGRMSSMIRLCSNSRLNEIGSDRNALSSSWYKRERNKYAEHRRNLESVNRTMRLAGSARDLSRQAVKLAGQIKRGDYMCLRKNLNSFFRYEHPEYGAKDRLWTTFKEYYGDLSADGYSKSYLSCTARSVNDYGDRHCLAYLVNVFMRPEVYQFYHQIGVKANEEQYALATLVQWVWRSAIRNGEPVTLYLPSERMRRLLVDWIENCEHEYNELYSGDAAAAV